MLNLEQAPSVKAQHAKAVHQRMQQAMLRLEPVTLCSACGTMAPCHRETCLTILLSLKEEDSRVVAFPVPASLPVAFGDGTAGLTQAPQA